MSCDINCVEGAIVCLIWQSSVMLRIRETYAWWLTEMWLTSVHTYDWQVLLSQEALRQMGDEEPNVFCTWEFYEYEIQSTPVLRGPK